MRLPCGEEANAFKIPSNIGLEERDPGRLSGRLADGPGDGDL